MPISMNPKETKEISLASDQALPVDRRPVFIVKPLTAAETLELNRCTQEWDPQKSTTLDLIETAFETAALAIVGWRHMVDPSTGEEVPYNGKDSLMRWLTLNEGLELLNSAVAAYSLDEADLGNSESPSGTGTDGSSTPATDPAAAASAPASSSPSTSVAPAATIGNSTPAPAAVERATSS